VAKRRKSPTSATRVTAEIKLTPRKAWRATTRGLRAQVSTSSAMLFVSRSVRATGEAERVLAVRLHPLPGLRGHECRRDYDAVEARGRQGALQPEAGGSRLVAALHRAEPAQPLHQLRDVVWKSPEERRGLPSGIRDRDGDRVLVDIETDEPYRFHGWTCLPLMALRRWASPLNGVTHDSRDCGSSHPVSLLGGRPGA